MDHPPPKINRAHLDRIRKICLGYPEVVEVVQFGSPWWKAGKKSFCIYGSSDGVSGASFNLPVEQQAVLVQDERFYVSHYIGRHGWTSMAMTGRVDWTLVRELIDTAYRKVALKRMLKTLDA